MKKAVLRTISVYADQISWRIDDAEYKAAYRILDKNFTIQLQESVALNVSAAGDEVPSLIGPIRDAAKVRRNSLS